MESHKKEINITKYKEIDKERVMKRVNINKDV
jgi:hypothetical protein